MLNTDRPLDGVTTIRTKLAILVGVSIVAAVLVAEIGVRAEVPLWVTLPVTLAVALLVTRFLSRGMTSPLREMTDAARRMARGDHGVQVTATSQDEVGQLARAFTSMSAELAAVDLQRRQLIATVSHELRTPLTAQRALLENLVDGVATDPAALQTALTQSERLSDLVENLLDLSRIDGGQAALDLRELSVADLVAPGVAEACAAAEATGRGIRLESSVPEGLIVTADRGRLAQVLANLLDNAVRHSPDGGLVRVTAASEGAAAWSLEVADEGPGIPADLAEQVFDRFGSYREGGGGTGLGLAIARWVCDLHGGTIAVVPGGEGGRLRVTLPLTPTARPVTPAVGAGPVTPAVGADVAPTPVPLHRDLVGEQGLSLAGTWPERDDRPQPRILFAALAVGVLGAAVLPNTPAASSLGLALVVLAAAAVMLLAGGARLDRWGRVNVALAGGLALLMVVRADDAIALVGVLVSVLLAAASLTRARTLFGMALSALAWPGSAVRGLPLLGRTLTAARRVNLLWPVVRTVILSTVVLVLFGGLFAGADAVFGSWLRDLVPALPDLDWTWLTSRAFLWFAVGGVTLAGGYLALNPPSVDLRPLGPPRPVARVWEWAVPMGLLVALFVTFLAAQAAALFGGDDYVRRTAGLTYAEYVHSGFTALALVTALVTVVVAVALRKAPVDTASGRSLTRGLLLTLCVLTLFVVASAIWRMYLYQEAYGFTVLRLWVDAFELWVALVIVLLGWAAWRLDAAFVPRAALSLGAAALLLLGALGPEARVASWNIDRYQAGGTLDRSYLGSLGADAWPIIERRLPSDLARCIVVGPGSGEDAGGVDGQSRLLGGNLGRAEGRASYDRLKALPPAECTMRP